MASSDHPSAQLALHGLRPKKHFGQNFLADARLAERIAELATTPPGGTVIELGAGLGALTRPLLARAERVVAVERDRDLVPLLASALTSPKLRVAEDDAKTVNVSALLEGGPRPHVLAGNLPYQITGPLLEKTVGLSRALDRAVFLVQLEVADRVSAAPGTPAYGALSVFVQAAFSPTRAFVIKRGAFHPQPGVDSAVLVLEPRAALLAEEDDAFRGLVRAAFGQRRKKLRNAWHGVLGTDGAALAAAAERAKVSLEQRGETLGVADFARMAQELRR
ncbi:MAG: 16S rRNA (adenine(1518)-N(6)/adenine(1519)-N(6))-dimethyltransferase RsmA [Sorangiineae bacterium]|nr:16S rRNA (adenine(1518)-N(6)/adenine(1519)-N(6))-dimethyltransferase RsmA [Polyangiaceae bacterium]MEB2323488.1 16S rRNA (adenine(1518)-N(6)/adenine(1519)-N(6))-dimethyltransferase RsmA [Sorangiineae bacterium]